MRIFVKPQPVFDGMFGERASDTGLQIFAKTCTSKTGKQAHVLRINACAYDMTQKTPPSSNERAGAELRQELTSIPLQSSTQCIDAGRAWPGMQIFVKTPLFTSRGAGARARTDLR